MKIDQKDIPQIVKSFWKAEFPEDELKDCFFLNKDKDNSNEWGALVFECKSEKNKIYIAVHTIKEQHFARKLTEDEINYLLFGTIPIN